MNADKILKIQIYYQEVKNHKAVMERFGLNSAQEYAINIFGRDKDLSPEYLVDKLGNVENGMTIGEVAMALGFEAEEAI